jgi:hypothetical protein
MDAVGLEILERELAADRKVLADATHSVRKTKLRRTYGKRSGKVKGTSALWKPFTARGSLLSARGRRGAGKKDNLFEAR